MQKHLGCNELFKVLCTGGDKPVSFYVEIPRCFKLELVEVTVCRYSKGRSWLRYQAASSVLYLQLFPPTSGTGRSDTCIEWYPKNWCSVLKCPAVKCFSFDSLHQSHAGQYYWVQQIYMVIFMFNWWLLRNLCKSMYLYRVVSDIHRDAQLPHSQDGLDEVQRKYQYNKLSIIGQQN